LSNRSYHSFSLSYSLQHRTLHSFPTRRSSDLDDSRAIPVFGREPDATKADGTLVPKAKVDPFLVHAAFKNDVHERRHTLNVKPGKLKWGIFGFLIALSVMLSFAAVYYTVLYGINMNCALHTKACP